MNSFHYRGGGNRNMPSAVAGCSHLDTEDSLGAAEKMWILPLNCIQHSTVQHHSSEITRQKWPGLRESRPNSTGRWIIWAGSVSRGSADIHRNPPCGGGRGLKMRWLYEIIVSAGETGPGVGFRNPRRLTTTEQLQPLLIRNPEFGKHCPTSGSWDTLQLSLGRLCQKCWIQDGAGPAGSTPGRGCLVPAASHLVR